MQPRTARHGRVIEPVDGPAGRAAHHLKSERSPASVEAAGEHDVEVGLADGVLLARRLRIDGHVHPEAVLALCSLLSLLLSLERLLHFACDGPTRKRMKREASKRTPQTAWEEGWETLRRPRAVKPEGARKFHSLARRERGERRAREDGDVWPSVAQREESSMIE
eukprot:scaffold265896_cov27-Tisochrysis_lutea.AAC.1